MMEEKTVEQTAQGPLYKSSPQTDEELRTLTIPKLGISIPMFEGTDPNQLAKGMGHFENGVLPEENNNSVLSGHRDTVFRQLGEVGEDDLLIVTADNRTVIVPKPQATLTVTTCYPFNYVGSVPKRYVLVAELIGMDVAEDIARSVTSKL